ncbi:MAG TPA: hypothetical protein VIB49_10700 [Thermoplasmata archaeon]|jgi:hypothetical protein
MHDVRKLKGPGGAIDRREGFSLGRWKEWYEEILEVDEGVAVGSVYVGYEDVWYLSEGGPSPTCPSYERLVIWKQRNTANALCVQIPHVNTDPCRRKLVRSRLQEFENPGGPDLNLYLIDYRRGREVFKMLPEKELPGAYSVVGLPPKLQESDDEHKIHAAHLS